MGRQPYDEEFTCQSPWLDLVNSEHWDGFGRVTDHLLDDVWVARFLKYWNVRRGELTRSPRAELHELRDLLRRAAEMIGSGGSLSRRDLQALDAFLGAPSRLRLVTEGDDIRTELRPLHRNMKWVRSRIVASFVDAVRGERTRIKICGNEQCRWAFLDTTKGNNRRWCRDRRCGNRDRVRRARARVRRRR